MSPEASISQAVREARSALGLSPQELALALKVSSPTIDRWESGKTKPQQQHLDALETLLRTKKLGDLADRIGSNGWVDAKPSEPMTGKPKAQGGEPPADRPSTTRSTDLTFLTNEPGNTLRDRFHTLLKRDTRFFDCLVGYFFSTGFHTLYPSLETVEKIRILVGLKTDRATHDAIRQAHEQQELQFSHAEVKEQVPEIILAECENAVDTQETEAGVRKFVDWVRSGKLEVRAYPTGNIHAKVYIMTFAEGDRDAGRVITGSSNLSQAGLQDNLEFNVELKNRADYEYSLQKFNELWADAVDVSPEFVRTIDTKSPYAQFTPYELYLKFLYEYFKSEVNRPSRLDESYLPPELRRLQYQEEAVLSAKRVLDEYGGVFLADVVGLGKTYMSALLALELGGRSLVIAPPHLLDETSPGSWPNVFGDFRVPQSDFVSIGKLEALLDRDLSKYDNVFVDEAHRFRTETTATYAMLATICRGKKVVLVGATPLNNRPADILAQIKLFQPGKNSTIPNVKNLDSFFATLERKLKGLDRHRDRDEYVRTVAENAREIRENVLKYLMVRRTRDEIVKYYGKDMAEQGLRFPEVADPEPLFYHLTKREGELFDQTAELIQRLSFARYQPLADQYFKGKLDQLERQTYVNLARFMRTLLVKRLESSFHAFRLTLGRFIRAYRSFIDEFENGRVFISKKHISKIFDSLEEGDEEAIERLLDEGKAQVLDARDFHPRFVQDLRSDLKILTDLQNSWSTVKGDPKWEAFARILKTNQGLSTGKLLIFTESQETAEYLAGRIRDGVERKTIWFSGASHEDERRAIIANFDARMKHPKDDYRILVTTDVLAEGVNLHRSNTVVNYDIPWNPTKLMQRVGRVNRVDTRFPSIHTFNFFPSTEGNDIIKLREAAEAKIQAFIEMLGSDAPLLTGSEEVKSHNLFARMNSRSTITGEDGPEESELEFIMEIRKVRDEQPELFERIKRLPKKARSGRAPGAVEGLGDNRPALLTYFRKGRLDKFFLADSKTPAASEINFFTAAHALRPDAATEKGLPGYPGFYALLDKNKDAFRETTSEESTEPRTATSHSNENYILKRLRAREISKAAEFTDDDEAFVKDTIRLFADGAAPRAISKTVAALLRREANPLKALGILRRSIRPELFSQSTSGARSSAGPREVILSSYLVEPQ
jgi:superfamily II DNA/RNA helicase/transcriptional regulator with XRE-family HTH domain